MSEIRNLVNELITLERGLANQRQYKMADVISRAANLIITQNQDHIKDDQDREDGSHNANEYKDPDGSDSERKHTATE